MRGISWLAADQLVSQEGLCTMEQISKTSLLPPALLCSWPHIVTPLKIWLQDVKNSTFQYPCTSVVHLQEVPVADPHTTLTISVHFTALTGDYIQKRILPLLPAFLHLEWFAFVYCILPKIYLQTCPEIIEWSFSSRWYGLFNCKLLFWKLRNAKVTDQFLATVLENKIF